jgi:hypothetical protein
MLTQLRVMPEQLGGARRDDCWQRIIVAQPRYAKYQAKTIERTPPN